MKKGNNKLGTIIWIICLAALAGCSPMVNVTTDYDRSTNFKQFQTFSFYQENPTEGRDKSGNYNTFLDQYLKAAIKQTLSQQGLRFDATNPDLKVAYDITVSTETAVNTNYAYAPGFGYGYSYWYGYRYNYGFNRMAVPYTTIDRYKEGTVVVDLVNPETNELVWRGVGEAVVDMRGNVSQERINTIVKDILKEYPPKSTGSTALGY